MQYDVIFAYLRLSRDDKEKIEESNSIKNQKLLIQHFVDNQPEFAGARLLFFADDGYSGTTSDYQEETDLYHCQRPEPPGKGYHRNTKLYRKNISISWGTLYFNQ